MLTKGARFRCKKCKGFTALVMKEEIISIGEYYLNFLTGAVKINIFCGKCGELLRYKIFNIKNKIVHKCNEVIKYDKDLNIIDEREGFKLESINTKIYNTIIQKRVRKNKYRKDHKTWKYVSLDVDILLKCLDCGRELNYNYKRNYRLHAFNKELK
jgi:hypothetical protein